VVKVLACGQAEQRPLYFSDSPILHLKEREQQELTKGVWFYELAELAMMSRADQYSIKRFITAEEERARAAYAHFKSNQARIAIFIGTFNTDENNDGLVEYLNPGDRRRWWPVRIGAVHPIDLAGLQRDRWQLFAEAREMHSDGLVERVWRSLRLSRDLWSDATAEQIEREKVDPYVEILAPLYAKAVGRTPRPQVDVKTRLDANQDQRRVMVSASARR
jgi:predicted P-loop ATPase